MILTIICPKEHTSQRKKGECDDTASSRDPVPMTVKKFSKEEGEKEEKN
jgi:hypothetical protein